MFAQIRYTFLTRSKLRIGLKAQRFLLRARPNAYSKFEREPKRKARTEYKSKRPTSN